MRLLFATAFLLCLLLPLLGSAKECPSIGDWRNATITRSGSLVCAKFYGDSNCSGFPMLLGLNSSIADLQHMFQLMNIAEGDVVTVLTRPLCRVTFWSDADFKGKQYTSSGYLWTTSINGVLSATCDCATENIELLSCEPKEELRLIQQCNYLNSSTGVICPYAIDTQPFKRDDGDGSAGITRFLTSDESESMNSLIGPRIANALDVPLRLLGDEDTKKYLVYASVKPHQALRISQRSILCGSYTLRTTEVKFDYEIAERNAWVLNPAAGRLYYFSLETERDARENAARRCQNLGGRLAFLHRPEESDFAVRAALKNFDNGTTRWWTAASLGPKIFETRWLRWEGRMDANTNIGFVGHEDLHCVLMKFVWPNDPGNSFFLAECETELPFVCEKYPEL